MVPTNFKSCVIFSFSCSCFIQFFSFCMDFSSLSIDNTLWSHKWLSFNSFSVFLVAQILNKAVPQILSRALLECYMKKIKTHEPTTRGTLFFRIKQDKAYSSFIHLDFENDFHEWRGCKILNPLTAEWALRALIDFTLSNARRFYSSMGNPLDGKGLKNQKFYMR